MGGGQVYIIVASRESVVIKALILLHIGVRFELRARPSLTA